MVEKQKRSIADEKNAQSVLKKENQSLMTTCEELQRKREKHEHELQTKDSRLACLEGQLAQTKRALEEETNKVRLNIEVSLHFFWNFILLKQKSYERYAI